MVKVNDNLRSGKRSSQIFCLVAGLVMAEILPVSAAPGPCIAPPVLTNPKQFIGKCPEDPGGPRNVVAEGSDVLIELPKDRTCGIGISVAKARDVRITGGHFVYTDTRSAVISLSHSSGTAFIDGVHINVNGRYADAIRTYRHTGTAVVQNTRIERVSGRKEGPHGDVVHAQGGGPLGQLVLQNVSGYTAYQGLFVPYLSGSAHGTHKLNLDRVNLGYERDLVVTKPLMLLFIGDNTHPTNRAPDLGTTLNAVYIDGSARGFAFERTIYAKPIKDGAGCAAFAPEQNVAGKVCDGLPPDGEFAPASEVGLNYRRDAFCS